MEFFTKTDIATPPFSLDHNHGILLMGSCFADEMGRRLMRDKFRVRCNPFGVLYNPMSLAVHLLRCVSRPDYADKTDELIDDSAHQQWLSWLHPSEFAAPSREELTAQLNAVQEAAATWLATCHTLVVTFGSSVVYRLKDSDLLVANCHKQPDTLFRRERLTAYDIADAWRTALRVLRGANPGLKVVLTVSPVRHKRDGLHGNQLSKAELLLACDALCQSEEGVSYFPSYEILTDELRDYRFYAPDMVHPSEQAADYIYERFCDAYVSPEEQRLSQRCRRLAAALAHRPFRADSDEYRQFVQRQADEISALRREHPALDLSEELALCLTRMRRRG